MERELCQIGRSFKIEEVLFDTIKALYNVS